MVKSFAAEVLSRITQTHSTAQHERDGENHMRATDLDNEQLVEERCDQLLRDHDPKTVPASQFLGHQFDLGLAWVHFPEGKGGLGLSRSKQSIVDDALREAKVPYHDLMVNPIGIGMGGE